MPSRQNSSQLKEVRKSDGKKAYLGDIFHSEMVVVGKPSADTSYSSKIQESYWRSLKGYDAWAETLKGREERIYVGGNDGILHSIDSKTGKEKWGFIPPFVMSKIPLVVNEGLNNVLGQNRGGTNAIFTVDGSPVVHDVYIQGFKIVANEDGEGGTSIVRESSKNWHTILFIPYGRGGPGFSVLDITKPDNPIHMYSIYNDRANGRVLHSDDNGMITANPYGSETFSIDQSLEAITA